jgi:ketosteroid isomerase-like protein
VSGVALVRTLYARAGSGDWDGAEELLSPDLVIHEPPSLPFGGDWTGRDALRRLFARVMGIWESPQVEIESIVGDDVHVVALLRFTMTSKAKGRTFTQPVAEVSVIEDGVIREMRIHYFDTAEVAREAG